MAEQPISAPRIEWFDDSRLTFHGDILSPEQEAIADARERNEELYSRQLATITKRENALVCERDKLDRKLAALAKRREKILNRGVGI